MSAPEPSVSAAKREVLNGLAQALAALARRIQGQGEAAHQVGLLTAQAEELAARAWEIACANRIDKEAAADLAAAVNSFITHAAGLSRRVAREASTSSALAKILCGEAAELEAAGRVLDGVNDMSVIRARLRPLLDRLTAIPARLAAMTEVAADVAGLGDMALAIAERTEGLQESGRTPGIAAVALYKELRGFANAAGSVASRMWDDEKQIQQTIAHMHKQTNQLASPAAAASAQRNATAIGRIHDVIRRTKAEPQQSPAEPPQPVRGMGWGYAPKPPR
jgi:hypothetical protein